MPKHSVATASFSPSTTRFSESPLTEIMKRKSSSAEDQSVADEPLPVQDLEQSAASESEAEASEQEQPPVANEKKRLKLQKKLKKLKQTYENRGRCNRSIWLAVS